MKLIPLTKGKFAQVDDKDFEYLSQWKWCYLNGYAVRTEIVYMHRVVAKTPKGLDADHKDNDRLNNQADNLRNCARGQNTKNKSLRANSKTGFIGVSKVDGKKQTKWAAVIGHDGKTTRLGTFNSPEEAARAYDKAARELFGEFARTNFV